jgi:hypothetical protein
MSVVWDTADNSRIGRKPVILIGLVGVVISGSLL